MHVTGYLFMSFIDLKWQYNIHLTFFINKALSLIFKERRNIKQLFAVDKTFFSQILSEI